MHLATIRVTIEVESGLRSKRKTVQAILDKLHRHFNVAVAELEGVTHPTQSVLGIAALAPTRREVRSLLDQVADALVAHPRANVVEVAWTDH